MVFHEITRDAIERALGETRDVDERLVDAQETRRILDRLYGYEVSPVLWKKVMRGLSAGRVQSVATRLVVERERERMAFRAAAYWDIVGDVRSRSRSRRGSSRSTGKRVAQGRDFGPDGKLAAATRASSTRTAARGLAERLEGVVVPASRASSEKPYVAPAEPRRS